MGAAIQAYLSASEQEGTDSSVPALVGGELVTINVSDVTSQALGVILLNEQDKEENFVVIPKNAKIPTKGEQYARTVVDRQEAILVRVTQGEDKEVRYVTEIGSKEIPIPIYPKGAPFRVAYAYDIDQTVYVELYDETAQKVVGKFEIDRIMNMNEEQVQNAIRRMEQMDIM